MNQAHPCSREAAPRRSSNSVPDEAPRFRAQPRTETSRKELSQMNRRTQLVASAVTIALALAPVAFAAKGGVKGNASSTAAAISLSAGPYSFGGSVSAATAVSADLMPWISMSCTQDGAVVGTATHAGFAGGS